MNIVKKVDRWSLVFGGEEHTGWLPPESARPLPTPEQLQVLEIKILANGDDEFLLVWREENEESEHDLWFADLPQAEETAKKYFGLGEGDW